MTMIVGFPRGAEASTRHNHEGCQARSLNQQAKNAEPDMRRPPFTEPLLPPNRRCASEAETEIAIRNHSLQEINSRNQE